MKKWLKKSALVWLTLSLIVSLLPVGSISAAAPTLTNSSIPNGEYVVDFDFLADGKTSISTANNFMKIPGTKGKLIVENGVIWFEHEVTTEYMNYFEYLGYRPEGVPKATIENSVVKDKTGYVDAVIRDGADVSRKIVRYGISNISQKQDVLMHINISAMHYNNWYNAQLNIDTSQLPSNGGGNPGEGGAVTLAKLNELISVTKAVYDSSVEGQDLGQFPAGSKFILNTAIAKAEADLAKVNAGDEAAYGAIYAELNQQLNHFRSLQKQANKTALREVVTSMTTFLSTATATGQANGKPGNAASAYVEGEYQYYIFNSLQDNVAAGKRILDNPVATQVAVDRAVLAINYDYDRVTKSKYVASEPFQLYVLDTKDATKTQSVYAGEVQAAVSTITELANKETLGELRANITLNVTPDDNKVYWFTSWDDGTYRSPDLYEQQNALTMVTMQPNKPLGATVYQYVIKNPDANKDTQWTGLGHITFKINGVKRSLYLSFNRMIHEKLQKSLALAQLNYKDAPKLPNVNQAAFDKAKADLLVAIHGATPISDNLNAERPSILNADAKLKEAFDAFRAVAYTNYELYFSTLHASEAAYSLIDGNVIKPAQVIPQADGRQAVRFTIKNSSSIKALQVERGGTYENVEVVSENAAANSRVVQFAVADLSQLLKAKVRIITSNAGSTSEEIHDIRFNFNGVNNTVLQATITDASNLLRNAVIGTKIGQYPEYAKEQLSAAIKEAEQTAVNGPDTEAHSAIALAELRSAVTMFKTSIITANDLKDGDYYIKFTVMKTDKEEASMINNYVVSPAKLNVSGGVKKIFVTLKQSEEIPDMKVNGQNVEVVSRSAKDNTRVVSFPVADLTVDTNGWAKFNWAAQNNFNEYDFRLRFDNSSVTNLDGTQPSLPKPGPGPGPWLPGGVLKDGYYFIDFRILKNGTESTSIANTYVVNPALLHIAGASKTVSFTVKRSKEIHTLTINGSSGSIVQQDAAKNTRTVSYSLPTLSGKHSGTVRIDWPEMKYHHSYDIQFAFNESTITTASGPSVPGSGQDGNVGAPGLSLPGSGLPGYVDPGKGKDSKEGKTDEGASTGTGEQGNVENEKQPSFGDTKNHWAEKHIVRAVNLGIVSGFKDGKFYPIKNITRGEFAAMLSRALELEGSASDSSFKDADNIPSWARKHVSLAVKNGLIVGYKDGTFKADKTMTRAELAVIIARAAKLKLNEESSSAFVDAKSIPSWAIKAVTAAVEAGLVQGKANNRFEPNATATRAEAVTLVLRLLDHKTTAGAAQK